MPRPTHMCMNDIVREGQNKKQQDFLRNTEEFPCLFNIEICKLDIGSRKYTGIAVCEIDVSENKLKSLQEDLNNDSEVSECDMEVWKDNLLTYVYAELSMYKDAFQLNKAVQDQHGKSNLIALVNEAFLFYKTGNLSEACRILDDLKKLKSQHSFVDLKIDAIFELGYAFRKLAGAKNLQFSMSFLEFALLFRPRNEQIQLMLGIVWRRCCHFNIYSADPENINRHDFALKAAESLFKLGTTSKNTSFKAAALIELAYLKYEDEVYSERNNNGKHSILSQEEWFQIVQDRSWKQLCDEATEACDDEPSEKVLKMAGQLYRYYGTDESLKKSEWLLKRAIAKRPSSRAHHHLGLTYKKMAVCHEQKRQGRLVGDNGRNDRQYMNNGSGNYTGEMKHANRGYYDQRFEGRREHTRHRSEFKNNARDGHNINGVDWIPREFVNSTIKMKPTGRGYHQQGFKFNYRPERNAHQENFYQHTQYVTDGCVTNDNYNNNSSFGNNAFQMRRIHQGNHHQSFSGQQKYNIHRQQNHVMVAANEYARNGYPIKPKESVNNMEMRHTNRGHHHQRFTCQSDHNKYEILGNTTEGAEGPGLQVLPEPPVNNTPQSPEKHLEYITKVPSRFKPYSKENPYTDKAIHHFQQAVDVSYYQNKGALYDLACILVHADNCEKSKEMCRNLIKECTCSKTLTFDPVYLVNAHNLYGICCAKEAEAEVDQLKKKQLEDESEEYLTLAVRLASYLASTVPELEMCVTDLWKAFRMLEKEFKFQGKKDSRDKLQTI